ncbi:MAG: hypothetical protein M1812_006744 [Candelaria pacifica]|nr:MAG: hypothetical protein M1812_006744 [Candelaria pacifica]
MSEEDEIRDVITVLRWSGRPHDWNERRQEWEERGRKLASFYFNKCHKPQHHGCGCSSPSDEPRENILLVKIKSNTNFATSNYHAIRQLRKRISANMTKRPDCRRVTIVMSQPDGLTTNPVGFKAFLESYRSLNLWLFVFDNNDKYAEYRASDVVDGISNFEQSLPVDPHTASYLNRAIEGGLRKEGLSLMHQGLIAIGLRKRNATDVDANQVPDPEVSNVAPIKSTKRPRPNEMVSSIECEECEETFSNADQLEQHQRLHDRNRHREVCGLCGALVLDVPLHQKNYCPRRKPTILMCPLSDCSSTFDSKRLLDRHYSIVHVQGPEIRGFAQSAGAYISEENEFVAASSQTSGSSIYHNMMIGRPISRTDENDNPSTTTLTQSLAATPSITSLKPPHQKTKIIRPRSSYRPRAEREDYVAYTVSETTGLTEVSPPQSQKVSTRRVNYRPTTAEITNLRDGQRAKAGENFTKLDDCIIIRMKEIEQKTWKEIADLEFPGRRWGTLQMRYSRQLLDLDS